MSGEGDELEMRRSIMNPLIDLLSFLLESSFEKRLEISLENRFEKILAAQMS